jgi:hypothetical protein
MSDNQYIKRLQRARSKPVFTLRNIIMLMILSVVIAGGFYLEYGGLDDGTCEGPCESLYSLQTWGIAVAMIFGAVILAGSLIGIILSLIKRSRGDALASLTDPENQD